MEIVQHKYDYNGERFYQLPSSPETPQVDLSKCEIVPYKIFDAYFSQKENPVTEIKVPFNAQKVKNNKSVLTLRLGTTNWFNIQSLDSIVDFLSETEAMGDLESLKGRNVNLYVSGGISISGIGIPKQ